MLIGSIKHCINCNQDSYVKSGVENCPICDENFQVKKGINQAPAGWVKMENYEISRKSVDKLLACGDLTERDLK